MSNSKNPLDPELARGFSDFNVFRGTCAYGRRSLKSNHRVTELFARTHICALQQNLDHSMFISLQA